MAQTIIAQETNDRRLAGLTILRFLVGAILIWKGISFIREISGLKSLIEQTGVGVFTQNSGTLAVVVTTLTLLCGFFITVGLFTRLSAIIQIPILLVALILVPANSVERSGFELVLSIVVLVLLVLFVLKGSGPLSADEYFRRGAEVDKKPDRRF